MKKKVTAITKGPMQHFFGYYDKCPWNASGRYVLSHEIDFDDHSPTGDDAITIGIIDLESDNSFEKVTETLSWSWQQGAMLQWHPGEAENTIIYNDCRNSRFISVVYDISSGKEKIFSRPIAAVSHNGKKALSLNFSRLADERPGYGYSGVADKYIDQDAPEQDGIYLLDLETGKHDLIISLAQIAGFEPTASMKNTKHWFNHILFSPDDRRFIFLHRWRTPDKWHLTRMFTANLDGSDIFCLNSHEMTSHFDWYDKRQVLAFAHRRNIGDKYYLFTDRSETVTITGDEKLSPLYDGHCSYSPDRQWILTDTYPNENSERLLLLYNPQKDQKVELGYFYEPEWEMEESRCDLHPRWSRDGRSICFDSLHSGSRQIYILDIPVK